MSDGRWKKLAREYLRDFRPQTYRELERSGKLEDHLDRKVEETHRKVNDLRSQGMTFEDAWQEARGILVPQNPAAGEEPVSRTQAAKLSKDKPKAA